MSAAAVLFHVSEDAGINLFQRRPDPGGRLGDVVWAIDEERLPNYLLPRDCPRLTFYAGPETKAADRLRFLGPVSARHIVAIESAWHERASRQPLHFYHLPPAQFRLSDGCAGYSVARGDVRSEACCFVPAALAELLRRDVEMRVVRSLWPLRDLVVLQFSIIRMQNGGPRGA